MKKFYDRELEMQRLQDMLRQAYEDYSRFVVLTFQPKRILNH